jgi:enoyl-CoA hydratase/carnithine racemase
MSNLIRIDLDARGVATVAVNRPAKLNALSNEVMGAFIEAFAGLPPDTRAVVLTGEGKAFIGGADVSELGALDLSTARAFITRVHQCCEAIRSFPAPVIARINGYCLGAGLEIAAACDLRAAAEDAVLGMPEVLLGIPSVVEAALLPRLVGWGRAREILLLGKTFSAREAADWGLVERCVPALELDRAVEDWLGGILACGANALRLQKALIQRWENLPMEESIAAGIDAFEASFESDEPNRMMGAFLAARRKP